MLKRGDNLEESFSTFLIYEAFPKPVCSNSSILKEIVHFFHNLQFMFFFVLNGIRTCFCKKIIKNLKKTKIPINSIHFFKAFKETWNIFWINQFIDLKKIQEINTFEKLFWFFLLHARNIAFNIWAGCNVMFHIPPFSLL